MSCKLRYPRPRLARTHPSSPTVLLFAGMCLVAPGAADAGAQVAQELTAEQAVGLALERSARLRAAGADAAASLAFARQVRAGALPSVQAAASYTRLVTEIPTLEFTLPGIDTAFTVLPVEQDRYHSEVAVEQVLFSGRLRGEVTAAAREAEAAGWLAAAERAEVAFEVRSAYWNLHRAIALEGAVAAALLHVDTHLGEVRTLLDEGAALGVELLAARTRRSEVLLERVEAENQVRVAQLEISRLTGLPLGTPVRPADALEVARAEGDLETLTAQAAALHPEVQALEARVQSMRARLGAARGGALPTVAFVGRYVYARPNPYFFVDQDRFRGTLELGLSLQWGIWEGGRASAEVLEARARLDAAEARLAEARERLEVAVARQFLEVRRAAEALEVAAQHVVEAEEALRVVGLQFAEAAALSAQVLEAERAWRLAQARQAAAVADHALSHAALLRAVGRVR